MNRLTLSLTIVGVVVLAGATAVVRAQSETRWIKAVTLECQTKKRDHKECKSGEITLGLKPDGTVVWK